MRFVRDVVSLALGCAAALSLVGCGTTNQTATQPSVVSISVAPASTPLSPGATVMLTVTATESSGSTVTLTKGLTFTSDNSSIASVNAATGLVTAGNVSGTAHISVTAVVSVNQTVSTTVPAAIVVTVPAAPLTSIALSPLAATLQPSGTKQLTVTGTYGDGSTAALPAAGETFTSSNTAVATVSATGLVTVAAGAAGGQTATITAKDTASGLTTSAANSTVITVSSGPVPTLTSIALAPLTASVAPGGTQPLTVTGTFSDGSTAVLPAAGETFTSSNTSVATVTAAGVATVAAGATGGQTATISAKDNASGLTTPLAQSTVITVVAPTTTNILSTGFNSTGTTTTSVAGASGSYSAYFGGANNPAGGSGGGYADQGTNPSYEYVYVQDTAANLAGYTYQGITVKAAASQVVSAAGYNSLSFTLAVNPEWFSSGPANFVVLIAGNVAGVSTSSCNPGVAAVVKATASAATAYTVPLTAFTTVVQNCGVATVTAAQILAAPVVSVDFQADGGGAAITASGLTSTTNTTVALSGSSPATFPTTLNVVGGVSFVNASSGPTTTNILSTGFNSNGTTTTSVAGASGGYSAYFGGANNPAGGSGGGYADQGTNPSYEYVYVQDTAANLAGYTFQGVSVQAATSQTVSASGYNSLSFSLAVNPEWLSSGPANFVVLITANVAGVSTASCNPAVAAVVAATASAATAYTVPLTAFTFVAQNCGVGTVTPAQILAGSVVAVDFQADGGGAAITASGLTSTTNTTVALAGSSPATYPTTINVVGGVSFVNASSGPATTNVLSTGFNSTGTTTTSVAGANGTYSAYFGGANNPAGGNGGGYADQGASPSYEYVYVQDTAANLAGYTFQGVSVKAAPSQTVSASGYNNLSFSLAVNPEWLSSGAANFVVLITANVSGVSTASCNPEVAAVVAATASAATAYLVPLTAFTFVAQNCGVGTVTPAQVLAGSVVAVDFQADGGGAAITASGLTSTTNTTVALSGSSPATYPTTVNVVGGVSFAP